MMSTEKINLNVSTLVRQYYCPFSFFPLHLKKEEKEIGLYSVQCSDSFAFSPREKKTGGERSVQ